MNREEIKGLKCKGCGAAVIIVKETFTAEVSLDNSDRRKIHAISLALQEKLTTEGFGSQTTSDVVGFLQPILEANIKTAPERERMVAIHEADKTDAQTQVTSGSPQHVRRLKANLAASCPRAVPPSGHIPDDVLVTSEDMRQAV